MKTRTQQIEELRKRVDSTALGKVATRPYSAEDVVKYRGS